MKVSLVILLCAVCAISGNPIEPEPEVTAPTGKIRGSTLNSRLGRKIYSFRGIRYAESPTGQRRFQHPVPAADWSDVFDASQEGPACPGLQAQLVSEDCLRLNVYSTKLPSKTENAKRPVMVFFHPGAFYVYSGQSRYFSPDYILDKDIVLVTVNNRQATLGLIATGDAQAPGNLALKDQVAALRWVKRNIAAFGGDPDSVTISGYSVGSLSVLLHMLSPMSKGLFHRAIAMSASLLTLELFPTEQTNIAVKQAELLNCPTNGTQAMLDCLRTKPVEDFGRTIVNFFEWYGDPIFVWKPVVEPDVPGVERFLTEQPIDLVRKGQFHHVPLITGITKDEFGGVITYYEKSEKTGNSTYRELDENWERIAPISFMYERGTPRSRYISRELRKFYFGDKPIGSETSQGLADLYADSAVIASVYRVGKLFAEYSREPVYFYMFTFQGRKSFAMWNDTTPYGVAHHDDLQYLFYLKDNFPYFEKNAPEIPMVELYTTMWTNFVETGKPVSASKELLKDIRWDRLVPSQSNYLDINLHPTMKNGVYPARMQLWERLFPFRPLSAPTKH